ncbi:hypothetical protein SELMODRAFT_426866 [Selaginella moellendorffii]|uniref:JmjC domain-containing protein n=1 Tax=Selaginella moellendorffii TaxID=88036 RepID=D8SXR7_SELML|nr:hypothetical protein SELMODRAFT_426866 [Selaginella moellendorffii]
MACLELERNECPTEQVKVIYSGFGYSKGWDWISYGQTRTCRKWCLREASGVVVPWVYIGMSLSSFCWHVEDHFFYSINYVHFGVEKVWYSVARSSATMLEDTIEETPARFVYEPVLPEAPAFYPNKTVSFVEVSNARTVMPRKTTRSAPSASESAGVKPVCAKFFSIWILSCNSLGKTKPNEEEACSVNIFKCLPPERSPDAISLGCVYASLNRCEEQFVVRNSRGQPSQSEQS